MTYPEPVLASRTQRYPASRSNGPPSLTERPRASGAAEADQAESARRGLPSTG